MTRKLSYLILLFLSLSCINMQAQSNEVIAKEKIKTLKKLIKDLEKQNITAFKEKLAIATAETFLEFANWDEKNVEENTRINKIEHFYKKDAEQMAKDLAEFERKDVMLLLDETIKYASKLISGEYKRAPYIRPDWSKLKLLDNRLLNGVKPVFLSDYTWKPRSKRLNTYFGDLNNFYINPVQLKNGINTLDSNVKDKFLNNLSDNAGFVFIGHNPPKWTTKSYGDDFTKFHGFPFTSYDIDNPGARIMLSNLFKIIVPKLAGTKYTQFGYMLANEPRWSNYTDGKKKVYFRADVSNYTIQKFKKWLQKRHKTIERLNTLWDTSFKNFEAVSSALPIDLSERGTAKWYDWTTFNDERVTDWFVFMKAEIRKYDLNAKIHLKIMPSIFTDNDPDSGIDFETLTQLSEINGNDIASHYNNKKKEIRDWEVDYAWGWRELYMGYDFLKSVQPKQINFNSESHLLSGAHVRDLYMNPNYARSAYWAAHTLGLNVTQTWYWPRKVDGSLRKGTGKGYPGSNNQQPRVIFELENTLLDLNRFSEDITAIQNQRKPIRIFYSKTNATQKSTYMDEIFELYENLNFEGLSLGFATEKIIRRINNSEWDVILVHKTEQVTSYELEALQTYLNNGGTILIDEFSLKGNEYNEPISNLNESNGKLIAVHSLEEMKMKAFTILERNANLPSLEIIENNRNDAKKCIWRLIKNKEGNAILSIINVGKERIQLTIKNRKNKSQINFKDKIKGIQISEKPTIEPYGVLFIEELKN